LGSTERTIAGRRQDGRIPSTPDKRIDLAAIIRAGLEACATAQRGGPSVVTVDQARIRLMTAQAEDREQKNRMAAGELIHGEDARSGVTLFVAASRARILEVPSSVAPVLVGQTDVNVIRSTLTERLHDALRELAEGGAIGAIEALARERAGVVESDAGDGEPVAPTAPAHGVGMGG